MKSLEYLDRVRRKTATGTDYATAKLLRISEDAVNGYRKGTRIMNDFTCLQVALELGVDPALVIAAAMHDRAKTKAERDAAMTLRRSVDARRG